MPSVWQGGITTGHWVECLPIRESVLKWKHHCSCCGSDLGEYSMMKPDGSGHYIFYPEDEKYFDSFVKEEYRKRMIEQKTGLCFYELCDGCYKKYKETKLTELTELTKLLKYCYKKYTWDGKLRI